MRARDLARALMHNRVCMHAFIFVRKSVGGDLRQTEKCLEISFYIKTCHPARTTRNNLTDFEDGKGTSPLPVDWKSGTPLSFSSRVLVAAAILSKIAQDRAWLCFNHTHGVGTCGQPQTSNFRCKTSDFRILNYLKHEKILVDYRMQNQATYNNIGHTPNLFQSWGRRRRRGRRTRRT